MTLPKLIAEKIEVQAKEWASSCLHDTAYMSPEFVEARRLGHIEGAQALYALLLESGPELDKVKAREMADTLAKEEGFSRDTDTYKIYSMGVKQGMGTQFDKCKALLSARDARIEELEDEIERLSLCYQIKPASDDLFRTLESKIDETMTKIREMYK